MDLNPNEGTRPSKLELGRYATGELTPAEAAGLEARLDDEARAWLAELEAAKGSLARFDPAALRARAGDPVADVAAQPAAANNRAWFGVLVALAAVVLGFVVMGSPTDPAEVDPNYIGVRGAAPSLEVFRHEGGSLRKIEGRSVAEGDQLGFRVDATGRDGVVLLSVDGHGQVSVFWPAEGNAPEPLRADGTVALPGSVILDGAPGPEVFLAVFDQTASEARDFAARTWQAGGPEALVDWAQSAEHVDAVVLERR